MQTEPQKFPTSVLIFIAVLTGIIVFLATRYHYDKKPELKRATEKRAEAQTKISEAATNRLIDRKTAVKNSNQQAARATGLVKTIKYEIPTIPDTTYTAMCEYITNYRYPSVAIEAGQP